MPDTNDVGTELTPDLVDRSLHAVAEGLGAIGWELNSHDETIALVHRIIAAQQEPDGESTAREIAYARSKGKPVTFMVHAEQSVHTEPGEPEQWQPGMDYR